ncbi:MAG TPA: DUF1018 domain-containing protein [Azoarcus taiwanensis]|nr:DUF1018 domain-containing protein [Azoarcus taiwanensis]
MATPLTLAQRRNQRMRAVFAECRAAGLDESARHELVRNLTGRESLKDCTMGELAEVVEHLRRKSGRTGARPDNPWAFVFAATADRRPMLQKCYRLAQRLGKLQDPPVPVVPPHYVEGIAARMLGAETRLQFCDPDTLWKVIAALNTHLRRLDR